MKSVIAAFLTCSLAIPAMGQAPAPGQIDGNNFDLLFSDPDSRTIGLISAVSAFEKDPSLGRLICLTPGVTKLQAAKVLDVFMQQNPQILNYPMHDITLMALMKAFPCA